LKILEAEDNTKVSYYCSTGSVGSQPDHCW